MKSGYGLLLGMMVCALVLASGCKNKPKPKDFKEFVSTEGHFKILMPGSPQDKSMPTPGQTVKYYALESKEEEWGAAFVESPIPAGESEAQLQQHLDRLRDVSLQAAGATLTHEIKITLNHKHPGREVKADLP